MATSKDTRFITTVIALLAIAAVIIHSSRYLPESVALFAVVAVLRATFAAGVAALVFFSVSFVCFLLRTTPPKGMALNVARLAFAVVIALMLLASYDNPFPDGVLNLYLFDRR